MLDKRTFLFITVLLCFGLTTHMVSQDKLKGEWEGRMDVRGNYLHMALDFMPDGDSLRAELFILEQNIKHYPASQLIFQSDSLTLNFNSLNARFEAVLELGDSLLNGHWVQGPYRLPLKLEKTEEAYPRPQEPEPPYPYVEQEITVENENADVSLVGTLTVSDTTRAYPLAILISGSGRQNRNSELLGHKPFWIIADHLTRAGIAVFRYDERGVEASSGDFYQATSEDFASDVIAIVNHFQNHPWIDAGHIGLIGHSEGGMIAPLVANKKDVAFLVLMAAPGVPITDLMLKQTELVLRAEGNDENTIQQTISLNRKIYQLSATIENRDSLLTKIEHETRKYYDNLPPESQQMLGNFQQFYLRTSSQVTTPWFRYFIRYNPEPVLKKIDCPVLAINGENDTQVSADENLAGIENALKEGENEQFTIREMEGLNHLFQESATGSFSEYAEIEQTFSPKALDLITSWIKQHVQ